MRKLLFVPAVVGAIVLSLFTAGSPASAAQVCNLTKISYGYQSTCSTDATGTQFRTAIGCTVVQYGPTIYTRYGTWQTQGGGRVSSARCDVGHYTSYGSVHFR
ncbi:hypothetical protein ACGGZK_06780 [Agromyces sp. MMS24-K17]|uniref:hypothetical protein n=1 Tax=Agromyces sp. MMS24-K17 TaxID=3372850 RepID=UPI003754AFAF